MAKYTTGDIQISGALPIETLLEFSISAKMNGHGKLRYSGIISEETGTNILARENSPDVVTVSLRGELIFVGQPTIISVHGKSSFFVLTVECASMSYLMDVESNCQSFQNPNMTYADVIDALFSKPNGHRALTLRGDNKNAIGPIVQYEETDWAFALRMASQIETVLVPNLCAAFPQMAFGVPRGNDYTVESAEYTSGRFRKKCNNGKWHEFPYYTVVDKDVFKLGDRVDFLGRRWLVVEALYELVGGSLRNSYVLGTEESYSLPQLYNDKLCGLSLLGSVIDTDGENVRLHLDIDKAQEKETAFWYPFRPQQGNAMYCMPQLGTKAYLKMGSRVDGECVVEHCHRTNGATCDGMADSDNRLFTSEFGKCMALLPDALLFHDGTSGIGLQDEGGIGATSEKELKIYACGTVTFRSCEKISIETPEQMILAQANSDSGIEISGNELHVHSGNVYIKGNASAQIAGAIKKETGKNVAIPRGVALKLCAMTPVAVDVSILAMKE